MALKPPILHPAKGFTAPKRPASEILEELRALAGGPLEGEFRVLPEGQDQPVAPEDLGEPRLRAPSLAGQQGIPGFAVGVGSTFQEVPSERFERFTPSAVTKRKRTARQIPAYPVGSPLIKPGMIEGVDYRTIQPGEVGAPLESLERAFPSPGPMEFPIDPTASPLAAQLATGRLKEPKQTPGEAIRDFALGQLGDLFELGETFWRDLEAGAPDAAAHVRTLVKALEVVEEFGLATTEEVGFKGNLLGPLEGIRAAIAVAKGGETQFPEASLLERIFADITNILPVVGVAGRVDDVRVLAKALKDEAVAQGKRVAPEVKRFAAAEAGRPGQGELPLVDADLVIRERREALEKSTREIAENIARVEGRLADLRSTDLLSDVGVFTDAQRESRIVEAQVESRSLSAALDDLMPELEELRRLAKDIEEFQPPGPAPRVAERIAEGAGAPPQEPPARPPAPAGAEPPDPRRAAIEAERVRRGLQAPPPLPPEPAADKLTRLIQAAKPGRTVTETMRRAERARRIAIHDSILEAGPPGPETARRARAALAGELPTMEFEALAPRFTPEDIADLFRKVLDMGPGFDRVTANRALEKVLLSGDLPQRGEIAMLERVFGRDLAQALVKRGGLSPTAWQNLMDAANIPRVIMTSYDVSAPLRQGLLFSATRPGEFAAANKAMFQALRSEAATEAIDAAIRVRPNATIAQDAGMYLAPRTGPTVSLTAREEAFMSRFARKIPGVRLSERAYVTYLNKLRADVFDTIYDGWIRKGKTPTDRETQALARYVNLATGRGSLGAFEDAAGVLTALFFSPRLQAARLELIPHLITAPNAVRKEMIKDMVGTAMTGFSILSLASMAGASVEWDPRSSDFGKIKIGNTRLDIWGGFQQYARMIAQVSTQQRKTLAKGDVRGVDPIGDVAASFARFKLSPQFGAMVDLIDRETAIGDPLLFPPEEGGAVRSFRERFAPMILSDVWDAVAEHGAGGFAVGLPAAFGVGVQTFEAGGGSPSGPRPPRSPRRIPLGGASSTTGSRRNAEDILAEWAAAAAAP